MRWKTVGALIGAVVIAVILPFALRVNAAPPFDRTATWTNPTSYSDGSPLGTDNIISHVFVCTSATDNTTCVEIGVSTPGATSWTGTSPQKVNETRWYALRAESQAYGTKSVYDTPTSFFLQPPFPAAHPPGKTMK